MSVDWPDSLGRRDWRDFQIYEETLNIYSRSNLSAEKLCYIGQNILNLVPKKNHSTDLSDTTMLAL